MLDKEKNNNVNLKKIELLGFKSFPDKTEIVFDTNYTGIVGPNGCGKSNIVDAVRWVLGEGRTTLLRCESMSKLIFEGSTSRKSFSYCEVSIYLNNNPRKYPVEYDEVVVTRKLDRSGISEYFINNKKHRLKDIISLFRDSGIGKDGYSIVGQGQISKIFESSPVNRRAIFEEAVGISLQKSQKEETERRLERARDNMLRLNDIIYEIENNLIPLKKEAKHAIEVKNLRKRLKILEVFLYLHKVSTSEIDKNNLSKHLLKTTEKLKEIESNISQANKDYNLSQIDRANMDILQSQLNDNKLRLSIEAEQAAGKKNVLEVKIETISKEINQLEKIVETENSLIESRTSEVEENLSKVAETKQAKSNIDVIILSEEKKHETKKQEVLSLEKAVEQANEMLLDDLSQKSKVDKETAEFALEKKIILDNINENNNAFKNKKSQLEALNNAMSKTEQELRALESDKSNFVQERDKYSKSYDALMKELDDINIKISIIEKEISNLEFQLKVTKENIEKYNAYDNAIQTIMEKGAKDDYFAKLYLGTVGDLIKVSRDLALSIEVALGNTIQNIIVEDENSASQLIDFLKQNESGRATFLPLTSMREIDKRFIDSGICEEDGVLGIASDLISYSPKIEKAILYLLGRTIIIQDKGIGIKISKKYKNLVKLVTLDGDIFHPSGAMTGGSTRLATRNILLNEANLNQIVNNRKKTENQLESFKQLQNDTKEKKEFAYNSFRVAEARIVQIDKDYAVKALEHNRNELLIKEFEKNLKLLSDEKTESLKRIQELDQLISVNMMKLGAMKKSEVSPEDFIEELKAKLFNSREEYASVQDSLNNYKIEQQSLINQIQNLNTQIIQLESQIKSSKKLIESSESKIENLKKELDDMKTNIDTSAFSEEDQAALKKIDEDIKKANDHKSLLDKKINELNDLRDKYNEEKSKMSENKYKIDNELSQINVILDSLADRVMQNYEFDYEKSKTFMNEQVDKEVKDSINPTKVNDEIRQINNKIDRIGPINELADEKYEESSERYESIKKQLTDLENAEKDMVRMIKSLTEEMSEKFAINFQKINENFQSMFKGLFGGGKAYLELEEGVDILDAGIEIKAQLPGSKMSSIISLSGGEKGLISIAILFAIIKLNPMPFCLLDEIDGALDEANADLLGQYLKKFSTDTQFVIVTHKKPTMEQCDVLYGITSSEKGVSQQVRVELEEAIELSQQIVEFNE